MVPFATMPPPLASATIGVLVTTGLGVLLGGPLTGAICLIAALLLAAAWYIPPIRRWLGLKLHRSAAAPGESSTETGRVGYKGHPSGTATFRGTTFGSDLDTSIDNEGQIDVQDSELK